MHYRASAELQDDGSVLTTHDFLDGIGKSLTIDNNEALVRLLITMNPVFRLRDARTARDGIERLPWGSVRAAAGRVGPASSPMSPSASASQNSGGAAGGAAVDGALLQRPGAHQTQASQPAGYRQSPHDPAQSRQPAGAAAQCGQPGAATGHGGHGGHAAHARGNRELEEGPDPY